MRNYFCILTIICLNISNAFASMVSSDTIFFNSLPEEQQKTINGILDTIDSSKIPLVEIIEANGDPVLLIQGLEFSKLPLEWIKPFHKLQQKKQLSYFFKWSKFNSIEENRDQLVLAIKSILEKHKDSNLTIIGYSAGGIIATFAMDTLFDDPISKRIYFHTIAAPLFGYQAPFLAIFGIPFAGKTAIQIGRGSFEKLIHKNFSQCTHWVNTNCTLDQHACNHQEVNPQLGPIDSVTSPLPCGNENIRRFNDETHASILNRVLLDILK